MFFFYVCGVLNKMQVKKTRGFLILTYFTKKLFTKLNCIYRFVPKKKTACCCF